MKRLKNQFIRRQEDKTKHLTSMVNEEHKINCWT